MADLVSTLKIEIDEDVAKALLSGFSEATANHLQSLNRYTDPDGSVWVRADELDATITKLRF